MEGNEHTLNMFTIDEGYYHFFLLLLDGNQFTTNTDLKRPVG